MEVDSVASRSAAQQVEEDEGEDLYLKMKEL